MFGFQYLVVSKVGEVDRYIRLLYRNDMPEPDTVTLLDAQEGI